MARSTSPRTALWRLTDGKPGHMKQTGALAAAVARLSGLSVVDIAIAGGLGAWLNAAAGRFPEGAGLPTPALILAAGHATHAGLLAAGRATGAPTIVVMSPTVPSRWFDLVIAPRHDGIAEAPNVVTTRGALAPVPRTGTHDPRKGVILVGGPSRHFVFDAEALRPRIAHLLAEFPDVAWTLSTSRRTPPDFLASIPDATNLEKVDVRATPPGWLEATFAACRFAFVTPDSVSMIHEALTAGCRTGIFPMQPVSGSKVAAGIAELERDGYIVAGEPSRNAPDRDFEPPHLDETARCAALIYERFLR